MSGWLDDDFEEAINTYAHHDSYLLMQKMGHPSSLLLKLGVERSIGVEEFDLEQRISYGEELVMQLPEFFRKRNIGSFIAVSFRTGDVVAIADTLVGLNAKLAQVKPREDYYVKRLGYEEVAELK